MRDLPVYGPDAIEDLIDELNREFNSSVGRILLLREELPKERAKVIEQIDQLICFAVDSEYWRSNTENSNETSASTDLVTKTDWPSYIQGFIANPADPVQLSWALEEARRILDLRFEAQRFSHELSIQKQKLDEVMNSSIELAEEHDFRSLCDKALTRMRRLIRAEGSSLYIVDHEKKEIRFVALQNERLATSWENKVLPLDESSVVGTAILRKQMLFMPDLELDSSTNQSKVFDRENQFKTRSLLTIPLMKHDKEVVGVVQLVNCENAKELEVDDLKLAQSFSNHVGAALERVLLQQSIENLFEGFIKASVTAIEARDPTTSGHSERVAELTLGLARSVHDSSHRSFKDFRFDAQHLKEIRYASLLHDFGKIGVPERVLVKEKKLFPDQIESLRLRMQFFKKLHPERAKEFEDLWSYILKANEPSILPEDLPSILKSYVDQDLEVEGERVPILKKEEWELLSIPKGSLSTAERRQIQSHVEHTYRFLAQIPWTKALGRVPEIAGSHHEKLNGKGYPRGLPAEKIPFESQIMAVADVFDALTAMDRPYKRAVSVDRAIEILKLEAKDYALNSELVQLFEEQNIYRSIGLKR